MCHPNLGHCKVDGVRKKRDVWKPFTASTRFSCKPKTVQETVYRFFFKNTFPSRHGLRPPHPCIQHVFTKHVLTTGLCATGWGTTLSGTPFLPKASCWHITSVRASCLCSQSPLQAISICRQIRSCISSKAQTTPLLNSPLWVFLSNSYLSMIRYLPCAHPFFSYSSPRMLTLIVVFIKSITNCWAGINTRESGWGHRTNGIFGSICGEIVSFLISS